jgi:hypothetical protein
MWRPQRVAILAFGLLFGCDDGTGGDGMSDMPAPDMIRQIRDAVVDMAPVDQGVDMADPLPDGGETDMPIDMFVPPPDSGIEPVCVDVPMPPPAPMIDTAARCRQGGPLRIRDLRDMRCPDWPQRPERLPGTPVVVEEAIVTAVFDDAFTIQDPEGGTYSALWVYNQRMELQDQLQPGHVVRVEGSLIEFFTLTELVPDASGITIVGMSPVPEPIVVDDPARIADGGDLVEALESVLVRVPYTRVLNTAPDCPRDFGMFVVSGNLRIGSEAEFDYEPARNDVVESVTGVLHYSFEHQKLFPRGDADIVATDCGGLPDKCEADECPVMPEDPETGRLIITEFQNNPFGDDALREYVEIYNPNPQPIAVDGWRLQDCAGNTLNMTGSIPARAYHVRARSVNRGENGGVPANGDMGEFFLPNGYGSILIFDDQDQLVDQVRYAPGGEEGWPDRRPGQSAELLEPAGDNRDGAGWVAGRDEYGDGGQGTPGRATR